MTWLEFAHRLQTKQDELFLDREGGGYFSSREGDEEIVLRLKDDQDGAEPSNNSIAAMNLLRLGKILDNAELEREGVDVFKAFFYLFDEIPRGCARHDGSSSLSLSKSSYDCVH